MANSAVPVLQLINDAMNDVPMLDANKSVLASEKTQLSDDVRKSILIPYHNTTADTHIILPIHTTTQSMQFQEPVNSSSHSQTTPLTAPIQTEQPNQTNSNSSNSPAQTAPPTPPQTALQNTPIQSYIMWAEKHPLKRGKQKLDCRCYHCRLRN